LLRITRDKTVIDLIVDGLLHMGLVRHITVVTNHKFSADFNAWARRHVHSHMICIEDDGTLSNEDRLGAIGDIHHVVTKKKSRMIPVESGTPFRQAFDGLIVLPSA
jgi:hypothetical protein